MDNENLRPIIVSGIGPGNSGVGRFISALLSLDNDVKIVSINVGPSLRLCLSNKRYISFFKEVFFRFVSRATFLLKILLIKNRNIIIVHPQTVGLGTVKFLSKYNTVQIYLVDNFWFCKKSYNVLSGSACFRCLESIDSSSSICKVSPIPYTQKTYSDFYTFIKRADIKFLVQTQTQKNLALKHFGPYAEIHVVGLPSIDLHEGRIPFLSANINCSVRRILFHGALVDAKGYFWVVDLARYLPDVEFLIPDVDNNLYPIPHNLKFIPCSWDSGLKDLMSNVDLVICPSLWSSVIEGALVKSLWFHGVVAVVNSEGSYINEIPDNISLKLSTSVKIAAQQIIDFNPLSIDYNLVQSFVLSNNKFALTEWNSVLRN